jgi:hydrogenase nickel incorporation protein HypA/HybF
MAQAVVRTVANAVPGRRVLAVRLRVGACSGVVPRALEFSWDIAVDGTPLAGARLEVDTVPLTVVCRDCGARTELPDPVGVRCLQCAGRSVDVVGGRELEVASVEVDDELPGTAHELDDDAPVAHAGAVPGAAS